MRPIKFRAWYDAEKKMSRVGDIDFRFEKVFLPDCPLDQGSQGLICPITWVQLMQYTGLKDKNGKEIYEGDIVSDEDEISLVEFHEGCFGVHIPSESLNQHECCQAFGEAMAKEYEVVGNIYENPDLIPK